MGKSAAANVIDLQAFRQRKLEEKRERQGREPRTAAVLVPVVVCWVPIWAPVFV